MYTTTPRAGHREWIGLAVLFLPTLLVAIDGTVLGFALPAIGVALAPSATQLLWIVDVYPLVLAGLLVTMGTLGDRIGRRKTLLIGVAGFGTISLLAAFATDPAQLVLARALMGFFGAMIMPATVAMLRSMFLDRDQRRLAIAVWATGFAAGAALGPIVGGVLLAHFWWGSVFLVNVPVMVALLVAAPLVLPESRNPAAGRLDLLGALLALLTMVPFVLAIKIVAHDGLTGTAGLAAGFGALAGWAFLRRANARIAAGEEPLLDLRLFRSPVLRLSALANATTMFAFTGVMFFAGQHLMLVSGLAPLDAGLVLLPGSIVTMVAGLYAARLGRRYPVRVLVPAGLLLAAGALVIGAALVGWQGALALGIASGLLGIGIGISETATNDAILTAAPADKAGSASALSETAYELGSVLGVAVLGSVLSVTYRAGVAVPPGVMRADAEISRETIGGAVDVAARHYGDTARALLQSAQEAFTTGVAITSLTGAAVLVAVATWVAVRLRHTD